MTNFINEEQNKFNQNRDSYQTAPLSTYSAENQRFAAEFYDKVTQLGVGSKRYKGSYSIFGISSSETIAKVVICEEGKGKVNGKWHVRPGVYVLIRANGGLGERNRSILATNGLLAVLPSSNTIGVAPAHGERFSYLRIDDTNLKQCLELLRVIARS